MVCSLGAIREIRNRMLIRLNHKVHVLFRRQDIDMVKLEGKIVIVLDVLFATTTIIFVCKREEMRLSSPV